MEVSEMMKYPEIKDILEKYWDNDKYTGVKDHTFVTTPSDSPKRNVKVKDLNNLASYQLVARLLLNTSHEYNGHKQVIFNTHITQEELLNIADCMNKITEEEEQEGFVTIRWSGPKSVDLYINDAWGGEGNNGHKDKLIAAWEW